MTTNTKLHRVRVAAQAMSARIRSLQSELDDMEVKSRVAFSPDYFDYSASIRSLRQMLSAARMQERNLLLQQVKLEQLPLVTGGGVR